MLYDCSNCLYVLVESGLYSLPLNCSHTTLILGASSVDASRERKRIQEVPSRRSTSAPSLGCAAEEKKEEDAPASEKKEAAAAVEKKEDTSAEETKAEEPKPEETKPEEEKKKD